MDIPLLVIAVLLAATLLAFVAGVFSYPFGLIVLAALLVARILALRGRRD